jgi:hypothetical protein
MRASSADIFATFITTALDAPEIFDCMSLTASSMDMLNFLAGLL